MLVITILALGSAQQVQSIFKTVRMQTQSRVQRQSYSIDNLTKTPSFQQVGGAE